MGSVPKKKYASVDEFVTNVLGLLERHDESLTMLDITDPLTGMYLLAWFYCSSFVLSLCKSAQTLHVLTWNAPENQLEGEASRFQAHVDESIDKDTVIRLINAAQGNPHINELFLGYVGINHEISMALVDLVVNDLTATERISRTNAAPATNENHGTGQKVWKRIALQGCPERVGETCVAILASQGRVKSLCLYQNHLDYHSFCSLGMVLSMNPPTLTTLDLEEHIIGDCAAALASGLSRSRVLEVLDLHDCRFDDRAIFELSKGFQQNKHIQMIQLTRCNLLDHQCAELLRGLRRHPTIRKIYLDCNFCDMYSISAMADMIRLNETPNLRILTFKHQLKLRGSPFPNAPIYLPAIRSLGESLATNSTLKVLSFSNNRLDRECVYHLMAGVNKSRLEVLDLSGCSLVDEDIEPVAHNLPPTLLRLYLHDNDYSEAISKKHLLEAIRGNTVLQCIQICKEHEQCQKELSYYAQLNRGGRKILSLSETFIPVSLWPSVLDRINRINWNDDVEAGNGYREDVLFYFILQGPFMTARKSR